MSSLIAGFLFVIASLMFVECGSRSTAQSPSQSLDKMSQKDVGTSTPFGDSSPAAQVWREFFGDGRYRVARGADFLFPSDAMTKRGADIERQMEFACSAGDLNGDGRSDRACIIVDDSLRTSERYSLIIINESDEKQATKKIYWLYKNSDLSKTFMGWDRDGLGITSYNSDGTYQLCRVSWRLQAADYSCD